MNAGNNAPVAEGWCKQLKFNPLPPLLSSGDGALIYYIRRDLLEIDPGPINRLWALPGAQRLLKNQLPDGSWPRSDEQQHAAINYGLIETWRQFRFLVCQYGFTREHLQARKAAEFLFSCQTEEGDFRGFLANQYATYYTGAMIGLLVDAGYGGDPRIEKGVNWLLSMRQDDGGWTIPILTHKLDRATQYRLTSEYAEPLEPDRTKPFSHNWTGMVLRAFAAHPHYRKTEAARDAAHLLKSRFFQADVYSSYQAASYWVRFDYPFWWNHLVAALDSLSLIGIPIADEQMQQAAGWLIAHQEESGLWKQSYAKPEQEEKQTARAQEQKRWISLAICRVLKRLCG